MCVVAGPAPVVRGLGGIWPHSPLLPSGEYATQHGRVGVTTVDCLGLACGAWHMQGVVSRLWRVGQEWCVYVWYVI